MSLKKYTPHLAAVIVFAIITIIQFNPLFKGRVINQSDIIQYKGMSKEAVDYRNTELAEALWTNSMFGGMPAYQVSTSYPGNPWLALAGSLAYGFSSYFFIILEVGHNSKANAIGYLAPILGGIILFNAA